jgi:hypothetical protein
MSDTSGLVWLPLIALGPIGAIFLHEITHYLTIWPVAESVRIQRKEKWRLETVYELYNEEWRMRYADISDLSPSLIGISLLLTFILLQPFAIKLETLWVVPTWFAYTVGGGADYTFI